MIGDDIIVMARGGVFHAVSYKPKRLWRVLKVKQARRYHHPGS